MKAGLVNDAPDTAATSQVCAASTSVRNAGIAMLLTAIELGSCVPA